MTASPFPGFPSAFVPFLRCSRDAEPLTVAGDSPVPAFIEAGELRCDRCGQTYPVADGIVSLLLEAPLHPESLKEMTRRDEGAVRAAERKATEWTSAFSEATEVRPTIEALGALDGAIIAELGCGPGRYTRRLATSAQAIVAIDFSRASLLLARERLGGTVRNVGLVQADVASLRLAPLAFDRVLSTLHSNLPTRDHRMASQRLSAEALKDTGRYVFSMHYHGLRDFLLGEPAAGAYPDTGIYRYHMRPGEARRETAPYFARMRFTPISIGVPGATNRIVFAIAQRFPVVRALGRLLLAVAEHPRRQPMPGRVTAHSTRIATLLGRRDRDLDR